MADKDMRCPLCGAGFKISEYVSAESVPCPECRQPVSLAEGQRARSALKLKTSPSSSPPPLPPPPEPKQKKSRLKKRDVHTPPTREPVATPANRPRAEEAPRTPRIIWGWIVFIVVSAAWIGLQYFSVKEGDIPDHYYWARLVVLPAVLLWVLIDAFQESYLPGILCIVLPPYLLYYALSRADSYLLRGAFSACLVMVLAEMYFIPEEAVITHGQAMVDSIIRGGANFIQRAGESPTY